MDNYSISAMVWTAVSVFLIGVSKGGIPVGPIALPLLILAWPGKTEPAKTAVAFMLPLLCVMDVFAIGFFRKHIDWKRLLPLLPGSIAGIILGSILFVSRDAAWLSIPDKGIKLCIGIVGLGFVFYQAAKKWIMKRIMTNNAVPGMLKGSAYGFSGGLVSTLAHASGPIMQMYLLPQGLDKMVFAGTTAIYFFILNLLKMVPFIMLGRIEASNLILGVYMLPLIPVGVALGYFLVKIMKEEHYTGLIYGVLFFTSITLIVKSITG
jgi:uncharacterized membrane protein YfcA